METNKTICSEHYTSSYDITTDRCLCYQGYYGKSCQHRIEWFGTILLIFNILESIILVLCGGWTIIRGYYMLKKKRLNKLVNLILILTLIGTISRFVYNWLPSVTMWGAPEGKIVTIVKVIILYFNVICWLCATTLIAAFWYDVLRLKRNITTKSKIVVLVLTLIEFIFYVIGVVLYFFEWAYLAIAGVNVLIFINIIFVIFYCVKIKNIKMKLMSTNNIAKKNWSSFLLIVVSVTWSIYLLSLLISILLSSLAQNYFLIITSCLYKICGAIINLSILLLLDYQAASLRTCINLKIFDGFSSEDDTLPKTTARTETTEKTLSV